METILQKAGVEQIDYKRLNEFCEKVTK